MLNWSGCVDISCYADFIDGSPGRTLEELQKFANRPKSRLIRCIHCQHPRLSRFSADERLTYRPKALGQRTPKGEVPTMDGSVSGLPRRTLPSRDVLFEPGFSVRAEKAAISENWKVC